MKSTSLNSPLRIPKDLCSALRCPGQPEVALQRVEEGMVCELEGRRRIFPVVDGTPVLINEPTSVFTFADFLAGGVTTMDLRHETVRQEGWVARVKNILRNSLPPKSKSVSDFTSEAALDRVLQERPRARVLVLGAGDVRFRVADQANIVYSDVALAPDTHLIADAHDIPFASATFDAVLVIAVLEHVADPYRCVTEIRRVLKPQGFVYATTPFLQQVHMGAYDFTRFTALGHRRLFRWFDEIRSGVANGPGMVVAWAVEAFITSFSENATSRNALLGLSRLLVWPFLLLDPLLARRRGAYDCASAYYFFGRLRETPISDREIVAGYRGLNGMGQSANISTP